MRSSSDDPRFRRGLARRVLATLVFAATFACAPWADAESGVSAARDRANALFQKGNQLRGAGRFTEALQQYQAAYRILPSYKILLNMGLTLYDTGRHVEAAAYFERFVRRGRDQSPPDKLQLATQRLVDLRRRLGRIWISCPVAGVAAEIDGKAVGITPLARWIYLAPGAHRLSLRSPGFKPVAREVTLRAGELRDLPVRLEARPVQKQPSRRADAAEADAAKAVTGEAVAERTPPSRARRTYLALGALGVGVALAAGGSVLWGLGMSQGSAADDAYHAAAGQLPAPQEREVEALYREKEGARKQVLAGTILLGAGAAALVVSAYCFLTRPATATRPAAAIVPSPLPGGGVLLTLRGSMEWPRR